MRAVGQLGRHLRGSSPAGPCQAGPSAPLAATGCHRPRRRNAPRTTVIRSPMRWSGAARQQAEPAGGDSVRLSMDNPDIARHGPTPHRCHPGGTSATGGRARSVDPRAGKHLLRPTVTTSSLRGNPSGAVVRRPSNRNDRPPSDSTAETGPSAVVRLPMRIRSCRRNRVPFGCASRMPVAFSADQPDPGTDVRSGGARARER